MKSGLCMDVHGGEQDGDHCGIAADQDGQALWRPGTVQDQQGLVGDMGCRGRPSPWHVFDVSHLGSRQDVLITL